MIPQLTLQPSPPDKSSLQQNRVWLYDTVSLGEVFDADNNVTHQSYHIGKGLFHAAEIE